MLSSSSTIDNDEQTVDIVSDFEGFGNNANQIVVMKLAIAFINDLSLNQTIQIRIVYEHRNFLM